MNFSTFPLWAELVLQPALAIFVGVATLAEYKQEEAAHTVSTGMVAILVLIILGHSLQSLFRSWEGLGWGFPVVKFLWPILLGLWVLVFIFLLLIYMEYEQSRLSSVPV